jgi:uncharacterized membrane protein
MLVLALSVVATAFLSFGARTAGENASYQLGQVIGTVAGAFVIAAVIWTVIWAARGRRRPWLSAWIGAIAVIVALLLAIARVGQTAARSQEVDAALDGKSVSTDVRECAVAALEGYDDGDAAARNRIPWTRAQFIRVSVGYCEEVERRGFFAREQFPSAQQQQAIMTDVVARMEAAGELENVSG